MWVIKFTSSCNYRPKTSTQMKLHNRSSEIIISAWNRSFLILVSCYSDYRFSKYSYCEDMCLNNFHCIKKKFSIKDFFSKCDQIRRKLLCRTLVCNFATIGLCHWCFPVKFWEKLSYWTEPSSERVQNQVKNLRCWFL